MKTYRAQEKMLPELVDVGIDVDVIVVVVIVGVVVVAVVAGLRK